MYTDIFWYDQEKKFTVTERFNSDLLIFFYLFYLLRPELRNVQIWVVYILPY